MTIMRQDLSYGIRILLKSPGFAIVAILILGLGIGATTAMFSIVNGVLFDPLPYPHSEQLVAVYERTPGVEKGPAVYLNFLDWQRNSRTFSSMAIYRNQNYNFTGRSETERLSGHMISADFFSTLGVTPVLGRAFGSADDQPGAAPVVILGGGFWVRDFGASPDVIGKTLTLNGASYLVVGVMPPNFMFYGSDRDVYTPIGQWNDPSFRDRRISVSAHVIGRLKPSVSLSRAKADMDVVARNLAAAFPLADKQTGISVISMKDDITGAVQPFLLMLLASVGFLMLIACANVANLLLARSMRRSREFAVRAALGASRGRITRQLLTESVLLAGMGGVLGVLIAVGATRAMLDAFPGILPRAEEISLDTRALLFTLALSLLAAIFFGLTPALKGATANLQQVLRESARGSGGGTHRAQKAFVAVEVAIAVMLLTGAGLMLRSLSALWRVNSGFNPHHAITFSMSMPSSSSTTSAETRARLRRFDEKMRSIPGVEAVSVTLGSRPMIHDSSLPFWIEGRPKPATDGEMPQAMYYLVEAGFAQAMGITLERGRFVTPGDNENTAVVIDIDDVFARTWFPHEDPIGKRVNLTQFNVQAEIVGVVGHVKQWGPGADERSAIEAQFCYPFMQLPEKIMPLAAGTVAVVLRTEGDPAAVMKQVRLGVQEMDRRQVLYGVQTMDEVVAGSLGPRRLSMILLAIFAALAVVLCCVGTYGVVSYVTGQRNHEIGVRVALGAQRGDVMRLVLGEGVRMALTGVVAGVAGSFLLTRLMANQLFGVSAYDSLTFSTVPILMMMVALLACCLPALRAMRIDPAAALRCE